MPAYVTAYELSGQTYGWPFAYIGLIPLLVGGIVSYGKIRLNWERPNSMMACIWCFLGVVSRAEGAGSVVTESRIFAAHRTGNYEVVEGVVTDFHPMPYGGHDQECFSVQQKRFCYSDYSIRPGFQNAASHGGPIRSGLSVRVAYVGTTIVRLEIAKDQ